MFMVMCLSGSAALGLSKRGRRQRTPIVTDDGIRVSLSRGDPQVKTLYIDMQADPSLASRIKTIEYRNTPLGPSGGYRDIMEDLNFKSWSRFIVRRCRPTTLSVNTNDRVSRSIGDIIDASNLENLSLKFGTWNSDSTSLWLPVINEASGTLKRLHIQFDKVKEALMAHSPLATGNRSLAQSPVATLHSLPHLQHFGFDGLSFTRNRPSSETLSLIRFLVMGVLQSSTPNKLRSLDWRASEHIDLLTEVLRLFGRELKTLTILQASHIPGLTRESDFLADAEAYARHMSCITGSQIETSSLPSLTPNLKDLTIFGLRQYRLSEYTISTLPPSLRNLKVLNVDEECMDMVANLLGTESRPLLPSLKKLSVPSSAMSASLLTTCRKRGIELKSAIIKDSDDRC